MAMALGLLAACASHAPAPPVFATGYIADRAVVRLWRKDDNQQHTTQLVTLSNALLDSTTSKNSPVVETRYQFVEGKVREIQRTHRNARQDSTHLRFAEDGSVSFMQRQLDDRRERLSDDEVALFQFDAKRLLELSELLRTGHVRQRQGQLQGNRVLSCEGQTLSPDFDASTRNYIAQQRQQLPERTLGVVWLEAPEGTQLLLVTEGDLCQWKPFLGE